METEKLIEQQLKVVRSLKNPIEQQSCALVVIDMQEYQVRREGSIASLFEKLVPGLLEYYVERIENIVIPNINRLLKLFRDHNLPVYFTKFAARRPDRKDLTKTYKELNKFAEKSIGEPLFPYEKNPKASIIPELNLHSNDVIIVKTTSGTFTSTDLDHQLRNLGIDTIIIVGVVTHFCVENTARIALDLGYKVFIIDDACAAFSPSLHEASLRIMGLFYISVLQTDNVIKKLEKKLKD